LSPSESAPQGGGFREIVLLNDFPEEKERGMGDILYSSCQREKDRGTRNS